MPKEVESLEQELRAEHDLYLRALADFDNYRRRVERTQSELGTLAKRPFILSLLDVVDDFERALGTEMDTDDPFVAGMHSVYQKLITILEKEDVHSFDSVGKPFDPALQEATATIAADEQPPDTVVAEVRRGYLWGEDLLRTARVIVAQ
jgi:molecular chaperone GrpE